MLEDMANHDYWEKNTFRNDQDFQHEELVASTPTIDALIETIEDCHLEEPTQREEHFELFHDHDSLTEIMIQDLAMEEQPQEEVSSTQPIVTILIIQDNIYKDPMWPIPPPPTLASFVHAPEAHTSKSNLVGATCRILSYLAKL
ncbi:hypothetical protein TIFTF001_016517 [Ficus carica]|uniref:Uncharacterized protein n=1 Tax=Ficus carica TaxID=3494 RepID=A0AA88A7V8_FICCA|nr:hypothetical protein TIFTF001_016517 [Ficus carica]